MKLSSALILLSASTTLLAMPVQVAEVQNSVRDLEARNKLVTAAHTVGSMVGAFEKGRASGGTKRRGLNFVETDFVDARDLAASSDPEARGIIGAALHVAGHVLEHHSGSSRRSADLELYGRDIEPLEDNLYERDFEDENLYDRDIHEDGDLYSRGFESYNGLEDRNRGASEKDRTSGGERRTLSFDEQNLLEERGILGAALHVAGHLLPK